jgi:3-oxoacyl-[acyl-carrier protein] reductase
VTGPTHQPLRGQVALITGGASGIGLATAHEMARRGASVAIAFHPDHPHDGVAAAESLAAHGFGVRAFPADVANSVHVDQLFEVVQSELGDPTIVVANAAIARRAPARVKTESVWTDVLSTNLSGVYHTFMAAAPAMIERGYGRLLATSSISGALVGWFEHAAYCASKAGIVGLVRALALDFASAAITVNAVAPGIIRTPQSLDDVNSLGPAGLDRVTGSIPLGRVGTPEDVAAAFCFLASQEAGYITGQLLVIDGGITLVESPE